MLYSRWTKTQCSKRSNHQFIEKTILPLPEEWQSWLISASYILTHLFSRYHMVSSYFQVHFIRISKFQVIINANVYFTVRIIWKHCLSVSFENIQVEIKDNKILKSGCLRPIIQIITCKCHVCNVINIKYLWVYSKSHQLSLLGWVAFENVISLFIFLFRWLLL